MALGASPLGHHKALIELQSRAAFVTHAHQLSCRNSDVVDFGRTRQLKSRVPLYTDETIGMHATMALDAFSALVSLTAKVVSGSGRRDAQVVTLLIWAKA